MRARFVPLVLAAMLIGTAVSGRAQDLRASDDQRKALIESLFVDAARFHEAQDYAHELDALEGVIRAANILNDFKQKDTAALERATNKVVALRSLAAQQVDAQVQVVRAVRAEIERVTGQFSSLVSLDIALDRLDGDRHVSDVASRVGEAAAFAREQEFSAGRVGLLTELTRAGERVIRVADQVCRAGSRDEAVAAVPAIEADVRRAREIEQQARRWERLRTGEGAGSPVDRGFMDGLKSDVAAASFQSSLLELSLTDFERNRGQTRENLEQAIRALRSRLVELDQEQSKLEPLIAFYQRCGAAVKFGEDQTPRWRIDVSADGAARARSQVTTLQSTLDAMGSWDAATARDTARRVKAESERLVAEWSEVGKIVADTDAAATSALAMVSDIRQRRDRATACVDGLSQRAASPPATPAAPAPAVVPPAQARDANAVGGGMTQPPAQPAAAAAPAPSPAQAQGPPAATPPPVDPNVAGGIKIQGPTTRIGVGERVRFVATDYGNRLYTKVTWTSFDDELLSIDSQGRATGLRPGKLLIHAALDDERAATLSVEVVEQPATPPSPTASAASVAPPASTTSGFQAGTTQAGPDTSRPAADRPAPATAPPPVTQASGGGRPSTTLLGIDVQGAPTPPAAGGFGVGATTAGRDPAPPSPGGGQPGGGGRGSQSPQRGSPPPGPGPQTRPIAGQPAAYHIFATGSRMGWASGLGQYSVGPADPSIVEHLQVAGEHIMWANRESFLPVTAWPNWPTNRAEVRSWADDLTRDPRNPTRRQITVRANSRAATLADELRYQTMGGAEYTATCDAAYMRLGYELGYGQQVLGIADEAARNGDRALARQARQDGMSHLQNSSRILSEYERIVPLTGRCADLRDVRTQLDAIYRLDIGDLSGQSRSTTAAWTLALERIAALRGGQPAPPAPAPPPSTPFFPPLPPSPPARPSGGQPVPAPAADPGTDPGELEGYWVNGQRIYRFVKHGDEYIGSLEHVSEDKAEEFGIRSGDQVYRLKRVGPNLYKGTYRKRQARDWSATTYALKRVDQQEPVWVSVLGVVAFGWGPGASTAYLAPVWIIRPPRAAGELGGAPDFYEGRGLIRVHKQGGDWIIPNGRRVRLHSGTVDSSDAYFSTLLFPADTNTLAPLSRSHPYWFVASRRNQDGTSLFIVFPDYDRAVAAGMPEVDPHGRLPRTPDDFRIDSQSREYLTRGGFSIIFGPASTSDVAIELGKYPQNVTSVQR